MTHQYRPAFDRLERRDVPSAAVPSFVNLTAGVLTVLGTEQADSINVNQSAGKITVSDSGRVLKQFTAAAVTKIVVDGGFGNDVVVIRNAVTKPARLYGGYGSDALYGGGGADVLYGGAEADYLFGRWNNDVLYGGSGTDHLDGGIGVNTLVQGTPGGARGLNAMEQEVVNLVNQQRLANGRLPLSVNLTLNHAAWIHSSQMAARSNSLTTPSAAMQHTLFGVNAPTPPSRLDAAGYDDWNTYGENIAFGYTTAADVMAGWMSSAGHRENILNPSFTEIGVSVVANAKSQFFWTQQFGAR